MNYIKRDLKNLILKNLADGFVNIIYGPRRVGKTVLLKQIEKDLDGKSVFFNGDTEESRSALSVTSEVRLERLVSGYDNIFVDEAQRIKNIGLSLKIIIDKFPQKKIFITGSSSLFLSKGARESLTGRNKSYTLFPFSTKELSQKWASYQIPALLPEQLIFGAYPYLSQISSKEDKINYLENIVEDYLFRDILLLERIDNPSVLKKLSSLLAFQVGSEVSLNELSLNLGVDVKTVGRYLDLLQKVFVVFSVDAYSRNPRKEISKSKKYYFYDLGIRNVLSNGFYGLDSRVDDGDLWENFLFIERKKCLEYKNKKANHYFWRNYQQAEIDMIEERQNKIKAFEFKIKNKKYRTPKNFTDNYNLQAEMINKENYLDFLEI